MRLLALLLPLAAILFPGCGPAAAGGSFYDDPPVAVDAAAVAAAGAVMEADTTTAAMQFVVDEDAMTSDSATKVPTQQSVKAYVDANAGGSAVYIDDYATIAAVSCVEGDTGYPTDSVYTLVCRVAGTWSYRIDGIAYDVTPPPTAGWTAYNTGSVVAEADGTRTLTLPAEAGGNWRGEYRAQPSDPTVTPYYVQGVLSVQWTGHDSALGAGGPTFTNGTGLAQLYRGGGFAYAVQRNSTPTTFAGTDSTVNGITPLYYDWRLEEDGTNRTFYLGDGQGNWITLGSFGRTVTITADSVGYVFYGAGGSYTRNVRLLSWQTGAL